MKTTWGKAVFEAETWVKLGPKGVSRRFPKRACGLPLHAGHELTSRAREFAKVVESRRRCETHGLSEALGCFLTAFHGI